jgi:hypothetical protein
MKRPKMSHDRPPYPWGYNLISFYLAYLPLVYSEIKYIKEDADIYDLVSFNLCDATQRNKSIIDHFISFFTKENVHI